MTTPTPNLADAKAAEAAASMLADSHNLLATLQMHMAVGMEVIPALHAAVEVYCILDPNSPVAREARAMAWVLVGLIVVGSNCADGQPDLSPTIHSRVTDSILSEQIAACRARMAAK